MSWLTNSRKSAQYIVVGRISITIAIFIPTFSSVGKAQDTDITNEYRATLVTSKPVSDKVVLFQYLGYVTAPDKSVKTIYYSPPGVIYKAKPWLEVWAGMFGLYNFNKNTANRYAAVHQATSRRRLHTY